MLVIFSFNYYTRQLVFGILLINQSSWSDYLDRYVKPEFMAIKRFFFPLLVINMLALKIHFAYISLNIAASHMIQ